MEGERLGVCTLVTVTDALVVVEAVRLVVGEKEAVTEHVAETELEGEGVREEV